MRILYLTQVLPYPPDSGAKVRQYHVLRHLVDRHEVTLLSFCRESDPPEAVAHLRRLCREVHTVPLQRGKVGEAAGLARSFVTGRPFSVVRDERRDMLAQAAALAGTDAYDVVHADQLAMAPYALAAAGAARRRPRLVLDAHNAYYLIPGRMAEAAGNPAARWFLRRESRLLARYEVETYSRFDHVITVTDEDRAHIQRQYVLSGRRPPPFTTIPICVDAAEPPLTLEPQPRGLLLLGGLHWPPNADGARWFLREVWPLVRAQVPEARVLIVGARPPADIRAFGDFPGIETPDAAGDAPVVVTGHVADTAPFVRAGAVLLAPLRSGGGMRVKIVEAMQWGLPVVSTTVGCEGIGAVPGRDLLLADSPDAFAGAVVQVLRDSACARRLADSGHRLVEQRYDWRRVYRAFDGVYAAEPSPEVPA